MHVTLCMLLHALLHVLLRHCMLLKRRLHVLLRVMHVHAMLLHVMQFCALNMHTRCYLGALLQACRQGGMCVNMCGNNGNTQNF